MAATSHTLFAVTLFLALSALKLWSERRHRISRAFRAGVARALTGTT